MFNLNLSKMMNQMRKAVMMSIALVFGVIMLQSCGENKETDLVESGTYTGVAEEVEPEEKEIYVRTPDDKLLELYFTDQTKLSKNGNEVSFDMLSEGTKVEVELEKKGKRLDPIHVEILSE
ncbi:hypothetical protein Echvi_4465 [Echinicola vietnamensis DSM 17526]|uniref:Uncharacterized protein n=3 Tax=Echinicola TaxID=390846 RepID=L0G716_ECHVK|nr:hypothetical protein Echvi_4465 [Echinicola vietnamensis DSM 17526]